MATAGFDPVYGARPLKRAIQSEIINPLAQSVLRGEISEGHKLVVDYQDGGVRIQTRTPDRIGHRLLAAWDLPLVIDQEKPSPLPSAGEVGESSDVGAE